MGKNNNNNNMVSTLNRVLFLCLKVGDNLERVKIGDIEISVVESERVNNSVEVTEKPVEKGQDVSDHVKQKPWTIEITGAVIGDDASDKLQKLKNYQKEGKLIKYIGRNVYGNMVIEDIGTSHEIQIRNGYEFNIKLKQVRIAKAKEVEIKVKNPATGKQDKKTATKVKPKANKGKQQPKKKKTSGEDKLAKYNLDSKHNATMRPI